MIYNQLTLIIFFILIKVNCGGRAYKNGLRVNYEILAVNNLEINKHPLTLIREIDQAGPEGNYFILKLIQIDN